MSYKTRPTGDFLKTGKSWKKFTMRKLLTISIMKFSTQYVCIKFV